MPTARTNTPKTPPPQLRRLSAVIRVSRRNGREGSSFMSPAEQRQAIEEWSQRNGVEVVSWWDETDSVSGKTTARAGLQGALDEAFNGRSDGVVCAKVDRFARNVTEGLTAVKKLQAQGKGFVAVREGIFGDEQSSTPMGRLWLTIILALAAWQLETLTEGWDAAVRNHIASGVARSEPYGYKRDAPPPGTPRIEWHRYTRQLRADTAEARHVKKMFAMRAAGTSWHAIADEMTARGARPARGGKEWTYGAVRGIVQNRVYLGELRSGDHVNLNAHKPIVGPDLWSRAQLPPSRTPGRGGRDVFLLAGLVRCAGCGARMAGTSSGTSKGKQTRYYRCRRRFSWGTCPAPAAAPADQLEALVVDRFAKGILSNDRYVGQRAASAEVDDAEVALRDAEAELRQFLESPAVEAMRRQLGDDYFEVGLTARTAAVNEARDRVVVARAEAIGVSLPPGIAELWADPRFPAEKRRLILSKVFPVIAVRAEDHRRTTHAERSGVDDSKRAKIFVADEPGMPHDLPGRGGTSKLRPIRWKA